MARTKKTRKIGCIPICTTFWPTTKKNHQKIIELGMDEYEAIRLYDYGDINMNEAAKKMKISASTFCRILRSAHKKIADALMNNKNIKICTQQCK